MEATFGPGHRLSVQVREELAQAKAAQAAAAIDKQP